eukprot:CAMPEP_0202451424 /NCGR_PEP_ID=MMETSP1360-20130828/9865_1 /ASSEMBLY_ACC=CAM_ASM_000848 /TAXON_ID=515479 /ORGANISM="Licmophora paradoxa, Strain CCMP2313" /LENGTH=366 /DNA_ID=CAMNT_0049069997 /DNA_START=74 /DNA_END=1174 /DNA_ORIENTATION=-
MGSTQSLMTRATACMLLVSSTGAFSIPSVTQHSRPAFIATPPPTIESSTRLYARRGGGGKRYQPRRQEEDKPPMNEDIEALELRVVVPNPSGGKDEPLGVLSKADALAKAQEMGGLDLILINNNSDPPVCKIVDYSKYRYMKEKKAKEVKKNSKASELKEVKMSYKIDVHDYDVRKKNAMKFLKQGNRVKCTIMFRGREMQHDRLGFELLEKLAEDLDAVCIKEGRPKREGRNLFAMLSPRAEVVKAVTDGKRKQEKDKKKKKEEAFKERLAGEEESGEAANAAAVAATTAATATALAEEDDLLTAMSKQLITGGQDDFDDNEKVDDNSSNGAVSVEDDEEDDEEDVESSLDALLGSDDLTDELFN